MPPEVLGYHHVSGQGAGVSRIWMAGLTSSGWLFAGRLSSLKEPSEHRHSSMHGAVRLDCHRSAQHSQRTSALTTCSVLKEFSSPKTGVVGAERFKDSAVPGTYWGQRDDGGEEVVVEFNCGSESVAVTARAGENLLRLAESCGVMTPNTDFCFEGSCCHCEMEVVGGAREIGYRAEARNAELIRSCICPVPQGRSNIRVNLINEEDVWGEGVV